jgi:plastocyanin
MRALRSVWVLLALVVTLALPLVSLQQVAVAWAQAGSVAVEVGASGFSPQEVTVPAGTTVDWTNSGSSLESVVASSSALPSRQQASSRTHRRSGVEPLVRSSSPMLRPVRPQRLFR